MCSTDYVYPFGRLNKKVKTISWRNTLQENAPLNYCNAKAYAANSPLRAVQNKSLINGQLTK